MENRLDLFLKKCFNRGDIIELIDENNIDYECYYEEKDSDKLKDYILKDNPVGLVVDDLSDRVYITYSNKKMISLLV